MVTSNYTRYYFDQSEKKEDKIDRLKWEIVLNSVKFCL